MPEHLGGVTLPFTVLGVATPIHIYLAGNYQLHEPLFATDYKCGRIFGERYALQRQIDVFELNLGNIHRRRHK